MSYKIPLKNTHEEIVGILGVSVDITAAKKEVSDKLQMLENIIAVMPGNVYWMNRDGVYLGCNENQAKVLGFKSRDEIVGKRNVDIGGFFIAEALDPVNKEVMTTGRTIVVEEPAKLSNGTVAIFLSSKVPIRNATNEIIGMLGISIDITDRKKLEKDLLWAKEQAETANKLKTEFIHNMEHDIRTPFNGIYALANLMEQDETDLKKTLLGSISQCAKELLDYCNNILDFSKTESGAVPLIAKKFNLKDLLRKVTTMEVPEAKSKKLEFLLDISEDIPRTVIGDPYRLERILLNLLGNAFKFTQQGHIRVTLVVKKRKINKLLFVWQ